MQRSYELRVKTQPGIVHSDDTILGPCACSNEALTRIRTLALFPHLKYPNPTPQGIPAPEQAQRTFMAAMSDSGLKPTVVYHNLNPAELYEKARLRLWALLEAGALCAAQRSLPT